MLSQMQCLLLLKMQRRIGKPLNNRAMKKLFTFAALAMVAIVACNKEIANPEENNARKEDAPQTEIKGDVTIIAQAPVETKTIVDGLDVKWASGDHIAVLDEDGAIHDFGLDTGEGTATGAFSGSFGGKASGGYAIYPYSANASYDGDFYVDYSNTYAYDAVTVPLFGEEGTGENVGKYSFTHIGGAFKISYYNVPAGTDSFVFTSTGNDITGKATFDGTDSTIPSGAKVVTVTGLPTQNALEFIVPVPATTAGSDYSFSVKLKQGDDVVPGSEKTVSSAKNVALGHVKPLKEIELPAAKGTNLWSENWGTQADADTKPLANYDNSGKNTYRSRTVFYTASLDGTVIYTTNRVQNLYVNPSNKSNELMLAKKASASDPASTLTISGVPTGNASEATLTFYTNTSTEARYQISTNTTNVSVGEITLTGASAPYKVVVPITIGSGVSSMDIVFSNTTTDNVRIDDIDLVVGLPEPGVLVTTKSATGVSSTGATLNGSLELINGGIIGDVTEAGFVVKEGDGEYGAPITVSLGGSTSFSKAISCSEGVTYHFKAYAKYNGGSAVYGEEREFIASAVVYATATSFAFTPNTTATWNKALPTSYDTNLTIYTLKADSTEWQFYDYDFNSGEIQFRNGSGYLITPPFASAVTQIIITGAATVGKSAKAQIYNAASPETKIADATVNTSNKTYTFTLTSQPTGAKYKITFTGAAGHCASMAVTY